MCVVAERPDGQVAGYARYRIKPDFDEAGAKGTVEVRELDGLDPAAVAALWRYLFGIDLVSSVRATRRPVDDPVLHLVGDIRR